MKVLILGHGNLGHDIYLGAQKRDYEAVVQSHSGNLGELSGEPDIIFNTVGGCAAGGAVDDPMSLLWKQNIIDNIELLKNHKNVIAFSSNSAMEPWRTPYAAIKKAMEAIPNLTIVRVGNLYGTFKPEQTFPGKLLARPVDSLPDNPIVPLPTDWLAENIFSNLSYLLRHKEKTYAPQGFTTVRVWGEHILGKSLKSLGLFEDRNVDNILKSNINFSVSWLNLWNERKHLFGIK